MRDGCARVQSMAAMAVLATAMFASSVRSFMVPARALTPRTHRGGSASSCYHAGLHVSPVQTLSVRSNRQDR